MVEFHRKNVTRTKGFHIWYDPRPSHCMQSSSTVVWPARKTEMKFLDPEFPDLKYQCPNSRPILKLVPIWQFSVFPGEGEEGGFCVVSIAHAARGGLPHKMKWEETTMRPLHTAAVLHVFGMWALPWCAATKYKLSFWDIICTRLPGYAAWRNRNFAQLKMERKHYISINPTNDNFGRPTSNMFWISRDIDVVEVEYKSRGPLAPDFLAYTSGLDFGPLDFVTSALRALRPCDPRNSD